MGISSSGSDFLCLLDTPVAVSPPSPSVASDRRDAVGFCVDIIVSGGGVEKALEVGRNSVANIITTKHPINNHDDDVPDDFILLLLEILGTVGELHVIFVYSSGKMNE
mmetsp:Transcript_5950/g.14099  ORF Transcript_5950/g.14099 Transcript_5950/m.14099 type:complete len:108 (-) Transcript_5950:73-396(-)